MDLHYFHSLSYLPEVFATVLVTFDLVLDATSCATFSKNCVIPAFIGFLIHCDELLNLRCVCLHICGGSEEWNGA